MSGKELMVRESSQMGQVAQADNDNQALAMWLYGRPQTTQLAYAYEVKALLAVVGEPLKAITLGDLQGDFSGLAYLAPASQARAINAAKSLFSCAQRIGYLTFNPCGAILSPKIKTPWQKGSGLKVRYTASWPLNHTPATGSCCAFCMLPDSGRLRSAA
jgi:hypothetical protein